MSDAAAAEAEADPANAGGVPNGGDGEGAGAEAEAQPNGNGADGGKTGGGDGGNVAWPDEWRLHLAGGDEKIAKRLGRYTDPSKVGAALAEAQDRIRSGELKQPLPEDADEETVKAWRAENGIPETPEGYLEGLPDGLQIGEEDKAGIDLLTQRMHAKNHSPAAVHDAIAAYYEHVDAVQAEIAKAEKDLTQETNDALRELWGPGEFTVNINDLNTWLDTGGVKDAVLAARTPDGKPLGSNPEFLKWAVEQMRVIDPVISVVGAGGGDPGQRLDAEIAQIEKTMREDMKAYEADKQMQQRYLQLIDARNKRKT